MPWFLCLRSQWQFFCSFDQCQVNTNLKVLLCYFSVIFSTTKNWAWNCSWTEDWCHAPSFYLTTIASTGLGSSTHTYTCMYCKLLLLRHFFMFALGVKFDVVLFLSSLCYVTPFLLKYRTTWTSDMHLSFFVNLHVLSNFPSTWYIMQSVFAFLLLLVFVLLCQCKHPTRVLSPRVVKIKYGSLRGLLITLEGRNATNFFNSRQSNRNESLESKGFVEVFLGVPYASPPVGSLRWMPPTTTSLYWKGTRLFTKFASVCPQVLPTKQEDVQDESREEKATRMSFNLVLSNQSEDCLYLNVYSPYHSSGKDEGEWRIIIMKMWPRHYIYFLFYINECSLQCFSHFSGERRLCSVVETQWV